MSTVLDGHDASAAHPLLALADALEDLLTKATDAPTWSMTPADLQDVLPRLTRVRSRVAEVELRVLAEADRAGVGDDVGSTNTPAWFAHVTGQRVPTARAAAALAEQLDTGHAPTREALSAGRVNLEQARVIVHAIGELPADLGVALLTEAESHLVGLADLDGDSRLDPKALRIAGRKILEVVAPDVAEAHEAKALADEERRAAATASFTMRPDGHGSVLGRFKIPELHGAILAKHLNAIAAPRHQRSSSTSSTTESPATDGRPVARPLRWGLAFCEYLETRAANGTPKAGGVAATVVVTLGLASLLGADKAASLDTGEQIAASAARRLACEAGIIPAVLGGTSQVLDLGRKTRFHTEPQRIAMMHRDGGCAAKGCDWPPGMCHAHHLTPWSRGGKTSVDDGVLLCPRHHTLAHDARYQMTTGPNRKVTFARRT
jgi:hypothetical protein